jgi:hypothetical protein
VKIKESYVHNRTSEFTGLVEIAVEMKGSITHTSARNKMALSLVIKGVKTVECVMQVNYVTAY